MSSALLRCCLPAIAACIAILLAVQAEARVVGVVFDDSGSMRHSIQLPTFGVQLLAATFDGRDGKDRLFTARLSQFYHAFDPNWVQSSGNRLYRPRLPIGFGDVGPDNIDKLIAAASKPLYTEEDIRTQAILAQTIAKIREDWPEERVFTPYEPVEIMLQALARSTRPGEETYLVIISDGAFYDGESGMIPSPQRLRESYEKYKQRIPGNLKAFFVLILNGADPNQRDKMAALVRGQSVRSNLLEVFNGAPDVGTYEVDDFASLKAAMFDIIAQISATDQDRTGTVTKRKGETIELDLPFSITRLISLSVVEEGKPLPNLRDTSFAAADRLDLSPGMRTGDNQEGVIQGWPKTRLLGAVTQLRLQPALAPGHHTLTYDTPVEEEVTLLFRSDISLRWRLVDEKGAVVTTSESTKKPAEASMGRKHSLEVEVIDRAGQIVIDPHRLPGDATFTGSLFGAGGGQNVRLAPASAKAQVLGELRFEKEGVYEIVTTMRLPGFVTSRSAPVAVQVTDSNLNFTVKVDPVESCTQPCPALTVPVTLSPVKEAKPIAHIRTTVSAHRGGDFTLQVNGLPAGVFLAGPDGKPHHSDRKYSFNPGAENKFTLIRSNEWKGLTTARQPASIEVTLIWRALEPLIGEHITKFDILPIIPEIELIFRGHSQDPSGQRPLIVELADLADGHYGFDFFLRNAITLPTSDAFRVTTTWPLSWFLDPQITVAPPQDTGVDGYGIAVLPKVSKYCLCFLGHGTVPVTLDYLDPYGRPSAPARAEMTIEDNRNARLFACLHTLLMLILALYLVSVLVVSLLANRFPHRSRLAIEEPGSDYPRLVPLRGRNFTLLKALFWFLFGVPHERRRLEGLIFKARPQGAFVSIKGSSWPSFRLERLGLMLGEMVERQIEKKYTEIPLVWDDVLEERDRQPRILTLLKDFRQQRVMTGKASPQRRNPAAVATPGDSR